jgi:outer membrane protein TolC
LDGRAKKDALIAKKNALQQQSINVQKTLRHQVIQTYLQLQLNYEMIKVLQVAKSTAVANLKLTKDNLEAGYVKMVDVLAVELMISNLDHQLLETNQNIQNTSDQLSFLMGDSFDNNLDEFSISIWYQPIDTLSELDQSALLMEEISTDRSDLLAVQYNINAQQNQLTALQKADAIRLNAFGSYELNNSLDFKEAQHGYLIGMQASWRIFNGNKDKSAVQKAQIELEKYQTVLNQLTEKNKLELEIAKRKMTQAQSKISLTKKAIAQAKEVLRIKSNRYAEGLVLTTEILDAATKVAQMQMDYKEAVYQYRKTHEQILFYLEKN